MRKKRVLIHSNFCKAFTGFGKHKKNILKYLYNTGKYEIFEAANGKGKGDPSLSRLPWKCYGAVPHNYNFLQGEEQRKAGYGQFEIEGIIKEVKPDVYMGIEDIWAFSDMPHQSWWNRINTMIWTTLDSMPILQQAIDFAPKVDHYYVWASFAERAMKELGYDHVKTLRGSLDTSKFYRFPDEKREETRVRAGLNKDDFIVGFVFRNQLRKSVPNLLEGFKQFKKHEPKAKLLLHTHWAEGWDIPNLIQEKEINPEDVLTTYFCKNCGNYIIRPYMGQQKDCPICGAEKTLDTTNISYGVSEDQLNEIYNLMDVYVHPFTSGGQEIPIQEAKLTGLVTLVTNYSCGEDSCTGESGGLPLEWSEYREPGTQFIKASTCPDSICDRLLQVHRMDKEQKEALGEKARQWVIDNFSIEVIGRKLEEIIDSMPLIEDFDFTPKKFNQEYEFVGRDDDKEFLADMYQNILGDKVDENSKGFQIWLAKLKSGEVDQQGIHKHFINVAKHQNKQREQDKPFESFFNEEDEGRRIAVVIPESSTDVLLINSLLRNLQRKHKGHNIYIFTDPKYFELIEDNPAVHKCMPYAKNIDNPNILEGHGQHKGLFECAYFPHTTTQKFPCYIHNGN